MKRKNVEKSFSKKKKRKRNKHYKIRRALERSYKSILFSAKYDFKDNFSFIYLKLKRFSFEFPL